MTACPEAERRRLADRRVRRVSFRYPERRSGFDRRAAGRGRVRTPARRWLERYRRNPGALAAVLVVLVALSLLDLVMTVRALDRGAVELNPVMSVLFGAGPVVATVVKLGVTLAVAAGIWLLRRYRRVLQLSLLLVGAMSLVALYHLLGPLASVG